MLVCTKLGSAALETVHVLLDHKADPHITNKDGWTAVHIACRTGHYDIVKLLLDSFPALANIRSNNGRYPLHIASKCSFSFCYTYLMFIREQCFSVHVTIHVHACICMHECVRYRHKHMCTLLLTFDK